MSYSKLQTVQNTAARITLRMPRTEHTTPLLRMLHWLPSRIAYKIDSLCHTALTTHIQNICQSCWMCIHQQDHCVHCWIQTFLVLPQQGPSHTDSKHLLNRNPSTGTGSLAALELWKKRTHYHFYIIIYHDFLCTFLFSVISMWLSRFLGPLLL